LGQVSLGKYCPRKRLQCAKALGCVKVPFGLIPIPKAFSKKSPGITHYGQQQWQAGKTKGNQKRRTA